MPKFRNGKKKLSSIKIIVTGQAHKQGSQQLKKYNTEEKHHKQELTENEVNELKKKE